MVRIRAKYDNHKLISILSMKYDDKNINEWNEAKN